MKYCAQDARLLLRQSRDISSHHSPLILFATAQNYLLNSPKNLRSLGWGVSYRLSGYTGAMPYSELSSVSYRRLHFLSGISPSLVLSVETDAYDILCCTPVRDDPLTYPLEGCLPVVVSVDDVLETCAGRSERGVAFVLPSPPRCPGNESFRDLWECRFELCFDELFPDESDRLLLLLDELDDLRCFVLGDEPEEPLDDDEAREPLEGALASLCDSPSKALIASMRDTFESEARDR